MTTSPGATELLDKTRRGLAWLRRYHNAVIEEHPVAQPEEEFQRILDDTANMEVVLRSQGYQGCILGGEFHCPEDAVITCDHCAGISITPPPEPAEAPESPEPETNGHQQGSFF